MKRGELSLNSAEVSLEMFKPHKKNMLEMLIFLRVRSEELFDMQEEKHAHIKSALLSPWVG